MLRRLQDRQLSSSGWLIRRLVGAGKIISGALELVRTAGFRRTVPVGLIDTGFGPKKDWLRRR